MNKNLVFLAVCFSFVSLACCGPKLSTQGMAVKVAENAPAAQCRVIGAVEAEHKNEAAAQTELRNKAGLMHANTVVVTQHAEGEGRVKLIGQAYGCGTNKNCACHHSVSESCPHCISGHTDTSGPTPCPHCAAKTGQPLVAPTEPSQAPSAVAPVVPVTPEVPPANTSVTP